MREREPSRVMPEPLNYPYFAVEVEGQGRHVMRSLGPIVKAELLALMQEWQEERAAQDVEKPEEGADESEVRRWRAARLRRDALNYRIGGASIGLCWAHETLALSAQRSDFDDLLEYGEAVIGELHDAGYTELAQSELTAGCAKRMYGFRVDPSEVEKTADFSEAPKD